jgi:hypothetical protein
MNGVAIASISNWRNAPFHEIMPHHLLPSV